MNNTEKDNIRADRAEWLDGRQAAIHLGMSESHFNRLRHLFPASRLTGKPRYSRRMLDEQMTKSIG